MPGDKIEVGLEGTGGTVAGKVGGNHNIVGNGNLILQLPPEAAEELRKAFMQPAIKLMEGMDDREKEQAGVRIDQAIETSRSSESKIDALIQKSCWLKVKADEATRSAERLRYLSEAYEVLLEVMNLDSVNTEAMRHATIILMELTPDDKSDEQELLERARRILYSPKTEAERFGLAQTTFLLAKSSKPVAKEPMEEARSMFEKLGQAEWIKKCDEELAKIETPKPAADQPAIPKPGGASLNPGQVPGQMFPWMAQPTPSVAPPDAFVPVGSWTIQVSDGSTISATFQPVLPCQISINHPWLGNLSGMGDWLFLPPANLQFQVMLNGMVPFLASIFITGRQGDSYVGYGQDSQTYTFTRVV